MGDVGTGDGEHWHCALELGEPFGEGYLEVVRAWFYLAESYYKMF